MILLGNLCDKSVFFLFFFIFFHTFLSIVLFVLDKGWAWHNMIRLESKVDLTMPFQHTFLDFTFTYRSRWCTSSTASAIMSVSFVALGFLHSGCF